MKRRRYVVASVIAVAGFGALFAALPSHGSGTRVPIVGIRYRPGSIAVKAGSAVTFDNQSKLTHTASCIGCGVDSKDIQPGVFKTVTFTKPGTYQLFCRYHGQQGMLGRLVVS